MPDGADDLPPVDFRLRMQATMEAFTSAWGRGDVDKLMSLVGENPIYRMSSGVVFAGSDDVRAAFARMAKPSGHDDTQPSSPGRMHFFEDKCIAYWCLKLPSGDAGNVLVEGVDVIAFDKDARMISKDAYRKFGKISGS